MKDPELPSDEHLQWLVKARSDNQSVTLDLYLLIRINAAFFQNSISYHFVAQELAGAAFSLWRAVFLSDQTGETGKRLADVTKFLQTLVEDNSIAYQTDKNRKEWSYIYYLSNAHFRLREISETAPNIVYPDDVAPSLAPNKDGWRDAQVTLKNAVSRLRSVVEDR